MKTIINVSLIATALMLATACALLSPFALDAPARRAAGLTLQSYAVLQQAVLIYGQLPNCTEPPTRHVCKKPEHWRRVREAERTATLAIAAAAPVLNAQDLDAGELAAALAAIDQVRLALAEAHP